MRNLQRQILTLIGILGSAVFLWLAVRHLDVASIADAWRTSRPLPWVLVAALCYVVGHLVRGERCRLLVQGEATLTLPTASNIVVVGYASNNIFPARLGELVRAGMLVERTGVSFAQALTITFVERLFDGLAILVMLVASSLTVVTADWITTTARFGALVFGGALFVLVLAISLPSTLLSVASRLSARLGSKWHERMLRLVASVIAGGARLRRPQDAARVVVLSFVIWTLEAGMFVAILPAFGLPMNIAWGVIAMSVTNLGILVPSTPGFVGPFHFFCSSAIASFGVPAATALGYAVLVHLTFYVPVTLWGASALAWYGVQIGKTAALARAAKTAGAVEHLHGVAVHTIANVEPTPKPLPVTEFNIALVEAIVPEPPNGSSHDPAVLADVARFIQGQMGALPPRLLAMYNVGMSGFRLYVRLVTLRSFCGLRATRRRAVVSSWAFGPIGLFRQLFRPVRSTALLAYYEHPAVLAQLEPNSQARRSSHPNGSENPRQLPVINA